MKTIGIIGGFGPEATAEFYLRLLSHTRAHIIVRHVFVPRKLEHDALVDGKNLDKFVPFLIKAAKDLEVSGADLIVLPCNTLHVHEQAIINSISVPFVSIIDSTVKLLQKKQLKHVGILGSRITIKVNLFKKRANGTRFVSVPDKIQKRIDKGLDHFVGEQNGNLLTVALRDSFQFFNKKHVKNILIACTDFHDFCPNNTVVLDTLDILVEATVNML